MFHQRCLQKADYHLCKKCKWSPRLSSTCSCCVARIYFSIERFFFMKRFFTISYTWNCRNKTLKYERAWRSYIPRFLLTVADVNFTLQSEIVLKTKLTCVEGHEVFVWIERKHERQCFIFNSLLGVFYIPRWNTIAHVGHITSKSTVGKCLPRYGLAEFNGMNFVRISGFARYYCP